MVNKVTLIGRAGADVEFKSLESGTPVARASLATSESWKDKNGEWQEETQWHNVIFWRDLADRAQQRIRKGMLLYVEGKIQYRKWEKDGETRYATDIVATNFRALEKQQGDDRDHRNFPGEEPPSRGRAGEATATQADPQYTGSPAQPDSAGSGGEDLPF